MPTLSTWAASLGILSGSQHGSSSNCPPFDLGPLCLDVFAPFSIYDGFFSSLVSCTSSSPWWDQYGYTVLIVPSLPLLYALSAPCTFASSSPSSPSLPWFLPVTSRLTCLFFDFSPSFPPLSSLLWPAWAYCPARHFSILYVLSYPSISSFSAPLSSFLSPLSSLLHLFPASSAFKGVCPKRLCPTWQHLTNL